MKCFKILLELRNGNIQIRNFSNTRTLSFLPQKKLESKHCVIKEAERVVGYPTSFLSLRWILNDEIANVVAHIRRLIGTNHPLLKTVKSLLLRDEKATWGLIVLLMSKIAGLNSNFSELECDRTADILHSQRIIAEVTEMIKTSHLIHKGLININKRTEHVSDIAFGNTLALLCGDYLLSTSFNEVARLNNSQVQELISTCLRDLCESEFIGIRDRQNKPLPSKPLPLQTSMTIPYEVGMSPYRINHTLGNMKAEWILRNVVGGGSLLGKCCHCSLILANHEPHIQELGHIFGRSFALAWQASLEKDLLNDEKFSLVSAPVMMHLEDDPALYIEIEKSLDDCEKINYNLIREVVLAGSGIEKTVKLQKEFTESALNVLNKFPDSPSKNALNDIILTL